MSDRYIYADKVGAGPQHPDKKWGLFTEELTADQASARYALNAARRDEWFGIVLLEDGASQPRSYLQMSPRANGVMLEKLDAHGSVEASYSWGAYHQPEDGRAYEGNEDRLFLNSIVWYVYPDGERFFRRSSSIGTVNLEFRPDGYAKEDRVTRARRGESSQVETREFRSVDVTANWTPIPAFGDWGGFFHPEAASGSQDGSRPD